MNERLDPLATSWLMLDSADTPMHLGALLVFRRREGAGPEDVKLLAEELRGAGTPVAPWNLRLAGGPLRRLLPRWLEDGEIDLEYHVRHSALPEPGGERELGVLVSRLHSGALDLSRPLWECHLVEGLHGNRFAVYFKLHQSLLDVFSFLGALTGALSQDTESGAQAPWTMAQGDTQRAQAAAQMAEAVKALRSPSRALAAASSLGKAAVRSLRGRTPSGAKLHAPYRAPGSALNVAIDAQRRVATQQYELPRLEKLADAAGVSVDELVLYLCGSVLRRFLKEYNALPDPPLLAAVPGVPRNGHADLSSGALGFVSLATQHSDPRQRLEEVRASREAASEHLEALPDELLPLFTLATAGPFVLGQLSGIPQLVPRMFNLVIASLPGPQQPLYLDGARLEALYPLFPLTHDGALSISCLSYAGTLNVGFNGSREALPHLQRMAVYMGLALSDLEELLAGEAA